MDSSTTTTTTPAPGTRLPDGGLPGWGMVTPRAWDCTPLPTVGEVSPDLMGGRPNGYHPLPSRSHPQPTADHGLHPEQQASQREREIGGASVATRGEKVVTTWRPTRGLEVVRGGMGDDGWSEERRKPGGVSPGVGLRPVPTAIDRSVYEDRIIRHPDLVYDDGEISTRLPLYMSCQSTDLNDGRDIEGDEVRRRPSLSVLDDPQGIVVTQKFDPEYDRVIEQPPSYQQRSMYVSRPCAYNSGSAVEGRDVSVGIERRRPRQIVDEYDQRRDARVRDPDIHVRTGKYEPTNGYYSRKPFFGAQGDGDRSTNITCSMNANVDDVLMPPRKLMAVNKKEYVVADDCVHRPAKYVTRQSDGGIRRGHSRDRKEPGRSWPRRMLSSSDDDDDDDRALGRRSYRDYIRPQKFSGSGSFETFYAHFRNCASYNRWNETDQLAHLKSCLVAEAGQVLWDSSQETTNTLSKLIDVLTNRFGGAKQTDKYRMELRLRRRKAGESLSSLHQDIRRLMALAHPALPHESRETIASDYFIDSLNDVDFALKVRERVPATLDDALSIALQLEAWMKDAARVRCLEEQRDDNRARQRVRGAAATTYDRGAVEERMDRLETSISQQLSEFLRALPRPSQPLSSTNGISHLGHAPKAVSVAQTAPVNPSTNVMLGGPRSTHADSKRQDGPVRWPRSRSDSKPVTCWNCSEVGHLRRDCTKPVVDESWRQSVRCAGRGSAEVYLNMNLRGRVTPCLLDSGCEVTLVPKAVVDRARLITKPSTRKLSAANGTEINTIGEVSLPFLLNGRCIDTHALVSNDIEEVMLGVDWLREHYCIWDFGQNHLFIDGYPHVPLERRGPPKCRRVLLTDDVVLPAKKQVDVPVRSPVQSLRRLGCSTLLESQVVRPGVYTARTLLPGKTHGMVVRVVNTTARPQKLSAETCIGHLTPVDVLTTAVSDTSKITDESSRSSNAGDSFNAGRHFSAGYDSGAGRHFSAGYDSGAGRHFSAGYNSAAGQHFDARQQLNDEQPLVAEEATLEQCTNDGDVDDDHVGILVENLPAELSDAQRRSVRILLSCYTDIFSRDDFDVGRTNLVEHTIDTGNHRPVRQQLRRHPITHLDVIDHQVNEMLEHDIIEPAASPWASNVVLVRKKDGSYRFCVDYRRVNAVTYQDAYPLPHIDTCLNSLSGAGYFSTLDLRAGYHNIPIAENDRDKTAFITRKGCWRYKVMPFGLTCAPAVFQRLMDLVLCGLSYDICLVYLDDIIIVSTDFDTHLERLGLVFDRLRWAKLKLHPKKCTLLHRKVSFLGHVITENGIEMQEDKVAAVRDWPVPNNLSEVRSFLGLCSYYRRFVKSFADVAAPLHALSRKDAVFVWGPEQQKSFDHMKLVLTTAPILGMPRNEGTFYLDTDASDRGLGAVLSQVQEDREVVIAYSSRMLDKAERNYCVTRKELLAVVYGLRTYRQYLLGRRFTIRTDHSALRWLQRTPEPLAQQARWLTFIEQFNPFDIQHRAGSRHGNADSLSRKPESCRQCGNCQTTSILPTDPRPESYEQSVAEEQTSAAERALNTGRIANVESNTGDGQRVRAGYPVVRGQTSNTGPVCAAVEQRDRELVPDSATYYLPTDDQIAQHQQEDEDVGPVVRARLRQEEQPPVDEFLSSSEEAKILWSNWSWLRVRNGVVYRELPPKPGRPSVLQLIVPAVLRRRILQECHDVCAGHAGIQRTLDHLQRRAFWVGWRSDATRYCRTCDTCSRYHRGQLPRNAYLQPIQCGAPFERLSVDLTGPHPRSRRGSIYILSCIDPFTKWAECFPLPNKEAATVARVLVEQVFCRFGTPLALLTDKGKEVDGSLMQEICRLLGVDKMRTSGYKPSTNASVERFHRTLNNLLGKVVSDNQKDWCSWLPYVMAAYRSTRHDSTRFTPNYLVLGREVRTGLDVVYGTMPPGSPPSTYDDYIYEVRDRMRGAYCLVRQNLGVAANRYKHYYDLRVRPQEFHVGDQVLFFNPRRRAGRQEKWARKYEGPVFVTKVTGPNTVLLQRSSKSRPFHCHVEKCKLYRRDVEDGQYETVTSGSTREPTVVELEVQDPLGAVAGCPQEDAGRSPRPRRTRRLPSRYCD